MLDKTRVAVIGCGGISLTHFRGYASIPTVELVAMADVNLEAAQTRAKEFGGRPYADYREMFSAERPHAVSVCVPPYLHQRIAEDAMAHGAHVLCEKPLALSVQEGESMVRTASQYGVTLMTGLCYRFDENTTIAKRWVDEGRLGEPQLFRHAFAMLMRPQQFLETWFGSWEKGGGVLKEAMTHSMDLFRFFMGNAESVLASRGHLAYQDHAEDTALVMLRGGRGGFGTLQGTWAIPAKQNVVELLGSKGMISIDYDGRYSHLTADGWDLWFEAREAPGRIANEIGHFIDCARGQAQPLTVAEDGVEALRIAEGAAASVDAQRWMAVSGSGVL